MVTCLTHEEGVGGRIGFGIGECKVKVGERKRLREEMVGEL